MSEAQNERKRRAEERRQRILSGAATRLSRIYDRPVEETTPLSATPVELPSHEAPPSVERPPSPRDATTHHTVPSVVVEKKPHSHSSPLETAAVVMYVTNRLQIVIASLLAVWYVTFGFAQSSPLGLLFVSELTLISGSWMYFVLVPQYKARQVQLLRQERRFLRGLRGSWIPSLLYRIPGFATLHRTVDDLRLCYRIVYADVAVFTVLCVALCRLNVLPNAEL